MQTNKWYQIKHNETLFKCDYFQPEQLSHQRVVFIKMDSFKATSFANEYLEEGRL